MANATNQTRTATYPVSGYSVERSGRAWFAHLLVGGISLYFVKFRTKKLAESWALSRVGTDLVRTIPNPF